MLGCLVVPVASGAIPHALTARRPRRSGHPGVEVILAYAPPNWILTADNLPSSTEFFPLVPDIVEQFTELWGK